MDPRLRVLVLDRSPEFVRSLERFMRAAGVIEVRTANDGGAARARIADKLPHVLLLGWSPRDAEFGALLAEVMALPERPAVIALTLGTGEMAPAAKAAGADLVLRKDRVAELLPGMFAGLRLEWTQQWTPGI
jgi:chemotaxis response regulator CheB